MNWGDEEYVRLYIRDTVTWKLLGWEGRTVLLHMLRGKFDRSGVFVTGSHKLSRAVTAATELPPEVTERGLEQVMAEGVWVAGDGCLVWPGYVEAQTCKRTAKARKRDERARHAAEKAHRNEQPTASRNVTESHAGSQAVTLCHPEAEAEAEAEIPLPPSVLEAERHRPRDPLGDSLRGGPGGRADVRQVFEAWKLSCRFPNAKLRGTSDFDAETIAEAIDVYGLESCALVAQFAPNDGMVNGKDDERRTKHDSVRYIFGNKSAFDRILRAAQEAKAPERRKVLPSEQLRARLGGQ